MQILWKLKLDLGILFMSDEGLIITRDHTTNILPTSHYNYKKMSLSLFVECVKQLQMILEYSRYKYVSMYSTQAQITVQSTERHVSITKNTNVNISQISQL